MGRRQKNFKLRETTITKLEKLQQHYNKVTRSTDPFQKEVTQTDILEKLINDHYQELKEQGYETF
ncbi:hypothetical protein [Virgibacillus sp. SK37]|uniref:hypothetical protein n=1 Tax=Virgibacillus sp. SK37 TaxID=403957 RepID=UPI0004D1CA01|nr:hypothetical protein [Virgibacillus sp. SK37]AIF45742.1 hypothetical protein X953_19900 [Virgibacillus sp. SK37]